MLPERDDEGRQVFILRPGEYVSDIPYCIEVADRIVFATLYCWWRLNFIVVNLFKINNNFS